MPRNTGKVHNIRFAQNYLKNPSLGSYLIRKSSIGPDDIVVEIGPGYGILTRALLKAAHKVVAIEKDKQYYDFLKDKLREAKNLALLHADFRHFFLHDKEYKVFSNIPFNITSEIVKKLLFSHYPPLDTYLFTQKEAAERFCGKHYEYEFSIMTKPWFEYDIVHHFDRMDFSPVPSIDVCLLYIHRREIPLLPETEIILYRKFVQYGFERQKKDLMNNFEKIFTYKQWKHLCHDLKFPMHTAVRDLKVEQWVEIYKFFAESVEREKREAIERENI